MQSHRNFDVVIAAMLWKAAFSLFYHVSYFHTPCTKTTELTKRLSSNAADELNQITAIGGGALELKARKGAIVIGK